MSRGSPFIQANKVAAYDSMLSEQPSWTNSKPSNYLSG